MLKRLSQAEADGDRIWAVVRGSAVNHNGASAGLTVPNGSAQERVMQAALAQAGISSADVDYVETHAVGSQLADAIEMRAIGAVYGPGRAADRPLLVGTVKANVGHLEFAAGIAGVIKTALGMKQGKLPRHPHFKNPSSQIDWNRLPAQVVTDNVDWPPHPARPPLAAVSAFGMSGSNAHVVLEGYEDASNAVRQGNAWTFAGPPRPTPSTHPDATDDAARTHRKTRFLPLSGNSQVALRDQARQYLAWLDDALAPLSSEDERAAALADMAWTASVGRSQFPHRAGLIFDTLESLQNGLRTVAAMDANPDAPPPPLTGSEFRYPDAANGLDDPDANVAAVAQAFHDGHSVNFEALFAGETRRRVPLPTYPFQRRRHWFR